MHGLLTVLAPSLRLRAVKLALADAGHNRVCCVADGATVPTPQVLADLVREKLIEQMADIGAASTAANDKGTNDAVAAAPAATTI